MLEEKTQSDSISDPDSQYLEDGDLTSRLVTIFQHKLPSRCQSMTESSINWLKISFSQLMIFYARITCWKWSYQKVDQ